MAQRQDDAVADFHREYRPGLMAFFLRRVHNYSEAEDLTQEVFLRIAGGDAAMRKAEQYIFQTAANLLRDRARRSQVRADYAAGIRNIDGHQVDLLDPYRVAAGRQAMALLNEALTEMPERTRQIFLLFRYEHVDHRTIAESFGISVSAVEKHIYRAMARLITKIGDDA